jgi:hypothetical protein
MSPYNTGQSCHLQHEVVAHSCYELPSKLWLRLHCYAAHESRTVFLHRESFDTILDKTEQMLLKCHDEYCMAFDFHAQHNNAASATALTEAHNNYVQQLHAANGMIDQYYRETLPE